MSNEQERQLKDLSAPIFRRREVLAMTGLERGTLMGWEAMGLWAYTGPKEGHRLYSIIDVRRFFIARELMAAPLRMRPTDAWAILTEDATLALDSGATFLLMRGPSPLRGASTKDVKTYRLDTEQDVREVVAGVVGASPQVAILNVALIRLAAWDAIQSTVNDLARRLPGDSEEGDE